MKPIQIRWNLADTLQNLPHYWEHTVGSDHATMCLRGDWQKQMSRAHRDLGFEHVRFHGIFDDDMGTLIKHQDKLVDSFFNAEQIFDFLLSIGMRPFIELSFMPTALASGDQSVFHYKGNVTPPKDYDQWGAFIERFATHLVKRYGPEETEKWFFEVWNEPNLPSFWKGNQADYFRFYATTAKALRRAHPRLKVGGPSTAMSAWIPEFLSYCESQDLPVDFVSTHHYPTDAFGQPGDDTKAQLKASRPHVMADKAREVFQQARGKPVYYTEWNTSSNPFDEMHDTNYASAHIVRTVLEAYGLVKGYSYWTFSDLFEENYFSSKAFHGGFGLMTIDGIPKPAYRAFELLHRLGNELHPQSIQERTTSAWLVRKSPKRWMVLATNAALPEHEVTTEMVQIDLAGAEITSLMIERIDSENANSYEAWKKMNSPERPSRFETQTLKRVSQLVPHQLDWQSVNGGSRFEFTLPPQGVACLTLDLK